MATVKFAVVDVGDFLSKKQAAEPDLATDWAQLEELYNKKLWHQLTLKLQEFVKHPALQANENLIQLYHNFLCTFENKINPLSLVEILSHTIHQYSDKKDAVAFLQKLEGKVKANDEALALCKVLQGQIHLEQLNDLDSTEKIITDLEGSLEDADGVTPVHGKFYKLASEYYRVRGPMAKYYRSALRYLGCSNAGADLPTHERRALALRLALAAVIAPTVYDLGELLAHPILEALENTPDSWALDLVRAVAAGDAAAFERVAKASRQAQPELQRADRQLRQKIAILCLMEMAFNRTSAQRRLSFSEIARAARVPHDEVELLVMKALAENLIKGHIDHVVPLSFDRWHEQSLTSSIFHRQMAFNRTSAQRRLSFSEIARAARVPHDEVELLVMKALAENLIKGHIDQVSETVSVSWVRPRALSRAGCAALATRLDQWCRSVAHAHRLLTQQAPDLLTL